MLQESARKRKPGGGRKKNFVATKAIRLPSPIADKLLEFKKKGTLESLYRVEIGKIFAGKVSSSFQTPLFETRVQAGFPSPTDDFSEGSLDLNEHLVRHKTSTFFVRATGDSMRDAGIFSGDLLIVDKALTPSYGKIVIAVLNGEMTVKRFEKIHNRIFLCSENEKYPDIKVTEHDDFSIWGIVTNVIHDLT
jgi:DNA polymerase V